jgi:hypothetical protein
MMRLALFMGAEVAVVLGVVYRREIHRLVESLRR